DDLRPSERQFRTELLERLLADRSVAVVLTALETVRSRQDSTLIIPLLSLLDNPVLASAAGDALVQLGTAVIDVALPRIEDNAAPANLPQVLERLDDPRALAVVMKMLTTPRAEDRTSVFRAYVQLLIREGAADAHQETIDALVAEECRAATKRLAMLRRLGRHPAVRLAADAVSDLVACHVQNALILLAARVRDIDVMLLHRQITRGTGEERSNALELLENVLPKALRDLLLAVLEAEGGDEQAADPEMTVLDLLSDPDSEWIVAGALWAAAELGLASDRIEALKDHHSPVVRETALFALNRLGAVS